MAKNDYIVRKVELTELRSIRDSWKRLECGSDMTFFQKYEWHEMVAKFVPSGKGIETGFFVVESEDNIVMIAPLWIITRTIRIVNKPGVFLIGRKGYSDYLNLIYYNFDESAFQSLIDYVKMNYGASAWNFEYLRDSSLLTYIRQKIKEEQFALKHDSSSTCCGVTLPMTVENYEASLSKNARKNLRNAINRSHTDGVSLIINYNDDTDIRSQCFEMRNEWLKMKIKRDNSNISMKGRIYLWLRNFFYERHLVQFPKYSPLVDSNNTKLLTIKDEGTGEIAAFFNYGEDYEHRSIVVITAGVNEKYRRYSPGFICIKDLICHCINNGKITYFDFIRGIEPYKYWLGAKDMKITNISFAAK